MVSRDDGDLVTSARERRQQPRGEHLHATDRRKKPVSPEQDAHVLSAGFTDGVYERSADGAMRHVLIIHYHFLPVHNVAVKRLLGYAKELPAFGWQTLVLTRDWRGLEQADPSWGLSWEPELQGDAACTIHRVPEPASTRPRKPVRNAALPAAAALLEYLPLGRHAGKALAKTKRMGRMLFGDYPDEFIRWVRPAVATGVRLARRQRIDAIMSYCPPETNHVVAHHLARRLDVPWVPFFGDLYGFLEPALPPLSLERFVRSAWHRWCLAPAAACVGVSPTMVEYLARTYRKPAALVHTGFDPDEFPETAGDPAPRRGRLVVSHIGSVYPGDQRPEILFDGLDELLDRHPEIEGRLEVRFVGSKCDARLHAMLEGRLAARVCSIQPKVDSASAIAMVHSSDILLAFTCTAHRDRHGTLSYPTKIFEAFGARRPVLAVPADGDWVDELLRRTQGGASARDAQDVAVKLWDWFSCWSREGSVPYDGVATEIAHFTRYRQAEVLAQLFDSVCGCR